MDTEHRKFLLVEFGIHVALFNVVLNAVIAGVGFFWVSPLPLWGFPGIAADTVATTFLLPFLLSLIATPIAQKQVREGRVSALPWKPGRYRVLGLLPSRARWRGVVLGLICTVTLAPVTIVLFVELNITEMQLVPFVVFKGLFTGILAGVLGPVVGFWAIAKMVAES